MSVGQSVTYVFLVNQEITGSMTYGDGTTVPYVRNYGGGEYFYTDYISGSASNNYVVPNDPSAVLEYNVGRNDYEPNYGSLRGCGNALNYISIQHNSLPVRNWGKGTKVVSRQKERLFSGESAYAIGSLTLTAISKNPPFALNPGIFLLLLNKN